VVKPAKPVVRRKLVRVKPVVYRRTSAGRVVVVHTGGGQTGGQGTGPTTGGQTDGGQGGAGADTTDSGDTGGSDLPVIAEVTPMDADDELAEHPSYEVVSVDGEAMSAVIKVDDEDVTVRMIGVAPLQPEANEESSDAPPRRQGRPGQRNITGLFLKNLLEGESVYVVYDSQVEDEDEDGNLVAYLYRAPDGLLVNMEVVRQGFAAVDTEYDFDDQTSLAHYQLKAQEHEKGLWGRLGRPRSQGQRLDRPDRPQTN